MKNPPALTSVTSSWVAMKPPERNQQKGYCSKPPQHKNCIQHDELSPARGVRIHPGAILSSRDARCRLGSEAIRRLIDIGLKAAQLMAQLFRNG